MTTPHIELLIAPDGVVKLQTFGFAGSSCTNADEVLRKSLGSVSAEELTPEYYLTKLDNSVATEVARKDVSR